MTQGFTPSPGPDIMLSLGSFQFGVASAAYQEFSRTTERRWPAQDRFGQRPTLQDTGPGADTITLPGIVFPQYRGGTGQVSALRSLMDEAQPQLLVSGDGQQLGRWVIERVDEKQTVFAARGIPKRQEFTVTLKKYDDGDSAAGIVSSVAAAVSAVAGGSSPLAGFASTAAGKSVADITSAIQRVQAVAGQIGSQGTAIIAAANSAKNLAGQIKSAADTAKQIKNAVTGAGNILQACQSAITGASILSGRIGSVVSGIGQAQGSASEAFKAAQNAATAINRMANTATQISSQAGKVISGG